MTAHGARTNRSVVDHVSQTAYPSDHLTKRIYAKVATHEKKTCAFEDCNTKLSFYNDTDFCSRHQNGNISLPKFI